MKTFQVFLGVAVLVLVLWVAATPVNADGKTLIGGWHWAGSCCWGNGPDDCYYSAPPAVCYYHKDLYLAYAGTGGTTIVYDVTPCTGNYYCNNAKDTDCSAGPNY